MTTDELDYICSDPNKKNGRKNNEIQQFTDVIARGRRS